MRNRRSADTALGNVANGANLPIPSKGYRMAARSGRRPSRQIKTLAALALSMTLGTALLSWVHDLTPARSSATTLRSFGSRPVWNSILVDTITPRGLNADGSVRGFHHLHIDRDGRLNESAAWRSEQPDPHQPGAIRIVITLDRASDDLTPRQWKRLTDTVAHLQTVHQIPRERIQVGQTGLASADGPHRDRLDQMLKTR